MNEKNTKSSRNERFNEKKMNENKKVEKGY